VRLKIHTFAEGKWGRLYGISIYDETTQNFSEHETERFLNRFKDTKWAEQAMDLRSRMKLMTEEFGVYDDLFRSAGSVSRPNLKALPDKASKHRLRIYAYHWPNTNFALVGKGCLKPHAEGKSTIDEFPDCRNAADFMAQVYAEIQRKKKKGTINWNQEEFTDQSGRFLEEFNLEI
jgi:hypothetical protein